MPPTGTQPFTPFDMKSGGSGFNPFDGIPGGGGAPSAQDRMRSAISQGYNVSGGGDPSTRLGRWSETRPLSTFGGGQATALDQIRGAITKDYGNFQAGVVQPYQEAVNRVSTGVESASGQIGDAATRSLDLLGGERAGLDAAGDAAAGKISASGDFLNGVLDKGNQDIDTGLSRARSDFDMSISSAKGAVNTAFEAVAGYDAQSAQNVQTIAGGLQQRYSSQVKMIEAGRDPQTGAPLNAGEQAQARAALEANLSSVISTQVGTLRTQNAQYSAGLREAASQAELAAGQLESEVGSKEGSLALAAADERTKNAATVAGTKADIEGRAEQTRLAYRNLSANLANTMASVLGSSALSAAQLSVQGRTALAQLIKDSPFMSTLEGLSAMLSFATAPGGRQVKAV